MSEKPLRPKLTMQDLQKQANLPDLDKINTDPEDIRDLIEQSLLSIRGKSSPSWKSYVKDIIVGIVLMLLSFVVSTGWQKMQPNDAPQTPQISDPEYRKL